MSKINSSPERHTFQKEGYVKRCEKEGKLPNPDYIEMYKTWREQAEENMVDPEWQKLNLEYDLRSTKWICDKSKSSNIYAQNLYAAMCNNDFQKNDVWPTLKNQTWSCSWRHAGGIIADIENKVITLIGTVLGFAAMVSQTKSTINFLNLIRNSI